MVMNGQVLIYIKVWGIMFMLVIKEYNKNTIIGYRLQKNLQLKTIFYLTLP